MTICLTGKRSTAELYSHSTPEWIRTITLQILSLLSLPVGLREQVPKKRFELLLFGS